MFEKLQSLDKKFVTHFSHNDMDGYAPKVLSHISKLNFAEFKHCSYENFEEELEGKISFYENHDYLEQFALLITDITPSNKELVGRLAKLHKNGLAIVLLDHHDTAKWIGVENPEWAIVESEIDGVLTCGTELYYKYLLEKELIEESPLMNSFVEHVRSYDTWDWTRVNPNNIFAKELNSLLYTLGATEWLKYQISKLESLFTNEDYYFNPTEQILVDIENKSEAAYIRARSKKLKQHKWNIGDEEYNVGVVFGERYHSSLGNQLADERRDLDFIAIIDAHNQKVSLRTVHDHIHVGNIAKAIGTGGGHPKAAGFQLQQDCAPKALMGTIHWIETDGKRFF